MCARARVCVGGVGGGGHYRQKGRAHIYVRAYVCVSVCVCGGGAL